MSDPSRKYWAFISYSHQDEQWAAWLHHALETYKIPAALVGRDLKNGAANASSKSDSGSTSESEKIPARLFPIFRDRDELAGASDLGAKLRDSLERSRTLIIVCSPRSAKSKWCNEEVRSFKALGRANRVFSLIVDGRPKSSIKSPGEDNECFPPALLYQVDENGQITDREASPLAADVRPGKESKNFARLKLIAGILGVEFDDLRQRDQARRRREAIRRRAMYCLAVILLFIGYGLLADTGVNVPGRAAIQLFLDRHDYSVVRSFPSDETVRAVAKEHREKLLQAYANNVGTTGWFNISFDKSLAKSTLSVEHDPCSHSQSMFAILNCSQPGRDLPVGWQNFDVLFSDDEAIKDQDRTFAQVCYLTPQRNDIPCESTWGLWYLAAAARGLQQNDRFAESQRNQLRRYVRDLQIGLQNFLTDKTGAAGWSVFPKQKDVQPSNAYSTVLAVQTLLELRAAGLGWHEGKLSEASSDDSQSIGNVSLRDEMLANSVKWLVDRFHQNATQAGWLGTGENALEVMDGMTFQIYATLLRVHQETDLQIPDKILEQIPLRLIDCLTRNENYAVQSGEFEGNIEWFDNPRLRCKEAYRFLWYPWAVMLSERWLKYSETHPQPHELVVQIRRVRAHLICDVGKPLVDDAAKNWTFIAAETLYGLTEIPSSENTSRNIATTETRRTQR